MLLAAAVSGGPGPYNSRSMRRLHAVLLLPGLLAACAPAPASIPVTLTAPAPTPTVAPLNLVPGMAVGASMSHADGATLVAVPSGPFRMGHGSAENPEHSLTLSDYWIYATKVTNAQYALCVAQERCTPPDPGDNPGYASFESRSWASPTTRRRPTATT